MYFYFCMILTVLLQVYAYGQESLISNDYDVQMLKSDTVAGKPDKGRIIQNGLFFLKSIEEARKDDGKNGKVSKTFEITIEKEGNYFFAANILPANNVEKISQYPIERRTVVDIAEVRVFVNDKFTGTLKQTTLEWELTTLNETKIIQLQEGKNIIRFETDAPCYPMVDAVRITETEKNLIVENREYNDFVAQLKSRTTRELQAAKETQEEIDQKAKKLQQEGSNLKSAMYPNSYDWQVWPQEFSNPLGIYNHRMNVPITFTYYRKLSLSKGNYTFITAPIQGDSYTTVDPVMYLYKINDPNNYSWYNDDYDYPGHGYHSQISVTNIPAGDYYLVIRAYNGYYASTSLGRQGLINVYQNGALLNSNQPVAGYMFQTNTLLSQYNIHPQINFFTAYSTGIPLIWLADRGINSSSLSNKIKHRGATFWNSNPPGDYYWFDDARIVININRLTTTPLEHYNMLVSAEGSWSFYFGNCDAYGPVSVGDPKILFPNSFPNLKLADCMVSAPASNNYNCASWAGGRTDLGRYFWASGYPDGSNFSSPWYVTCGYYPYYNCYPTDAQYWASWDNYFGNTPKRSATATTYSRTPNGLAGVSLWTDGGHAAVRLVGNLHPHGYEWESKAGGNVRIFHTENGLKGGIYGSTITYYYPVSSSTKSTSIPYEDELKLGLTAQQDVKLNTEEAAFVRRNNENKNASIKNKYKILLSAFIDKINLPEYSIISHPSFIVELSEYQDLKKYCQNNFDNLYYQIIEDAFSISELISEIVSGVFVGMTYEQNKSLMDEVKTSWERNCYTSKGEYIAPSPIANSKNYIKKMIDKEANSNKSEQNINGGALNNDDVFIVAPNPATSSSVMKFVLSKDSKITIKVTDMLGATVYVQISNAQYQKGNYEIPLNVSRLKSNTVYVCSLIVDDVVLNRRILFE